MATYDSALSHLSYQKWQDGDNTALVAYRSIVYGQKEAPSTVALVIGCAKNLLFAIGLTFASIPEFLCLNCSHSTSNWTKAKIYENFSGLCLAALFNHNKSFEALRALEIRASLNTLFDWEEADAQNGPRNDQALRDVFVNGFPLLSDLQQKKLILYVIENLSSRNQKAEYTEEFLAQFEQCISILETHKDIDQIGRSNLGLLHRTCKELPRLKSGNTPVPSSEPTTGQLLSSDPIIPQAAPAPTAQPAPTQENAATIVFNVLSVHGLDEPKDWNRRRMEGLDEKIKAHASDLIDLILTSKDKTRVGPAYVRFLAFCLSNKQWDVIKNLVEKLHTGVNRFHVQDQLATSPALDSAVQMFEKLWKDFPIAEQFEVVKMLYRSRMTIFLVSPLLPCLETIPATIFELAKKASPIPEEYQSFLNPLMPIKPFRDGHFDWLWFAHTCQSQNYINGAIGNILINGYLLDAELTEEQGNLFVDCMKTYDGPFKIVQSTIKEQGLSLKNFAKRYAQKHPEWAKVCSDHIEKHPIYSRLMSES